MQRRGLLIILSSPSGAGKSTMTKRLRAWDPSIRFSVSATTRAPRPGEEDGREYYFRSREAFEQMVATGEMLEHAEVFGNFYGSPKGPVVANMEGGVDTLFDIDWQGAQQIRQLIPSAQWIFIFPPSIDALELRLRKRGQDDETTIQRRLAAAHVELQHAAEANFIVINDVFEQALLDLQQIIATSRLRSGLMMARNPALLRRLGV